jgi:alanine racemase
MVRLGIGLYGVSNDPRTKYLENVGTLKSVISQIRTISAGESVGYGQFMAEKPTGCNNSIGYADGISRGWGMAWICNYKDKKTKIGSICMDMLMVDVTEINYRRRFGNNFWQPNRYSYCKS